MIPRPEPSGGTPDAQLVELSSELSRLLGYVVKVRAEVLAIGPQDIRTAQIPEASDHLGEVLNAAESAATRILDGCEHLERAFGDQGDELRQASAQIISGIYEACDFQDLTGQRIRKVNETLGHLEGKLAQLVRLLGISETPANGIGDDNRGQSLIEQFAHGAEAEGWAMEESPIQALIRELERLASFIAQAQTEVRDMGTPQDPRIRIDNASAHLDAVVQTTESSTTRIMDACEQLGMIAGEAGGALESAVGEILNGIRQACDFQEFAGQRIQKVSVILSYIEAKLEQLGHLFGTIGEDQPRSAPSATEADIDALFATASEADIDALFASVPSEEHLLLGGPALPGQGIDQDMVDRLLAEF